MKALADIRTTGAALLATRMSVLGDDPCGGSEVVLWEDAGILERAGVPVRVYGRAAKQGAPVRVLPLRTDAPLVTSTEYAAQLLYKERDALIISYNEPALAGWVPERTIARFDWSTALPRYWNWPLWLPRFQRARYLFPSQSERDSFLRNHPRIPTACANVIPNAVDLSIFRPCNSDREGPRRVGFAGQWVSGKGIETLLQAWTMIKYEMLSTELVLAGGPGLWKATVPNASAEICAARVREMEEKGTVRVVGALSRRDMPQFWNSVDIAVIPSFQESFGLVAIEAMACGIPVIASSVGGLTEIIQDGVSGMLVPPGNVEALAKTLTQLLENEMLRKRLAAGARRRAQNFSIEQRTKKILEFLNGRMKRPHEKECI